MNAYFFVSLLAAFWTLDQVGADDVQEQVQGPCPIPASFANGNYYYPHGTTKDANGTYWLEYNEMLEFYCDPEYHLIGNSKVVCESLEDWEEQFPICYRKSCPGPPPVKGGKWIGSSRKINSVVRLTCLEGYKMEDPDNRLRCKRVNDTELEWSGRHPTCRQLKICPDPGSPAEGTGHRFPKTKKFYEKTKVSYECHDDFEMVGKSTISCGEDGHWDMGRPRCKPNVTCPDLPPDPNGRFQVDPVQRRSDYYEPGDLVRLQCDWGFKPGSSGSDNPLCSHDATWDEPVAVCKRTACAPPKPPLNGHFVEKDLRDLYELGTEVRVRCEHGYRLNTLDWIGCTTRGWTSSSYKCIEIVCRDPGVPEFGSRQGPTSFFPINSTVSFSCWDGYTLAGSTVRSCLTNGQWDGTPATCTQEGSDQCPNPGIPMNGERTGNIFRIGHKVQFECHPLFTLIGSQERTCQPNGQWDGSPVTCRGENDFDRPEDIKIRLLSNVDTKKALKDSESPLDGMEARSLDTSTVLNSGGHLAFYFVFDSSDSVGKVNFNTSIKFAKALVRRIGVTPSIHYGAVSYGRTAKRVHFPDRDDNLETVLDALSKATYMGGGTHSSEALNDVHNMMSLVRERYHPSKVKSTIFLVTDGVYNIGGNPESKADVIKRDGAEIYVMALVGGHKTNGDSIVRIASKPEREHVYYMNKYETVEYLVDVLTTDNVDYSRCGISVRDDPDEGSRSEGKIFGGRRSTIHWPWMASLKIGRSKERRCGGSIIDNDWILTAAHCVVNLTNDDIHVTVGVLNLVTDETGDRQEMGVERFWVHPLYTKKYDYDVALLKLNRPVIYGKFVRSICLAPDITEISPASFLYRPGETAHVIGFGNTEGRSFSNALLETDLTIQNRTTCERSLPKSLAGHMTRRMICAGDSEGGKDAAKGDSGGPLMQELRDRSGQDEPYWVQIGVVSWGVEGKTGEKGFYGFYTHVAVVKTWIAQVQAGVHN